MMMVMSAVILMTLMTWAVDPALVSVGCAGLEITAGYVQVKVTFQILFWQVKMFNNNL